MYDHVVKCQRAGLCLSEHFLIVSCFYSQFLLLVLLCIQIDLIMQSVKLTFITVSTAILYTETTLLLFDVHSTTQFHRLLSLSSLADRPAKLLLASVPTHRPNLDFSIIC